MRRSNNTTFRLLSRSSFLEGMGRLVDFEGALNVYNESISDEKADFDALASDWRAVGVDIKEAINMYEQQGVKEAQ